MPEETLRTGDDDANSSETETSVEANDDTLNESANAGFDAAAGVPEANLASANDDDVAAIVSDASVVSQVTVTRRTGQRKVRGKVRTVNLPQFDCKIDGKLVAVGAMIGGKPIMEMGEVLPEEISEIQSAVMAFRGDETEPKYVPRKKITDAELAAMK
jgi:hypothetical protein